MSGMMVSISGILRAGTKNKGSRYMLQEFYNNLKALRDDPTKHKEFFDLYVFGDGNDNFNKKDGK